MAEYSYIRAQQCVCKVPAYLCIGKYNIQSDSSNVLTDHRPFLMMFNDLSSRSFFSKRLSIIYIEIMYPTYNNNFGVPILCYFNNICYVI